MMNEQRIIITFDEFFKNSSKTFFEKLGFRVETEVEIFNLPKRLDVLVIKNQNHKIPEEFTLFRYWKEYNLISFKSEPDKLQISDIWDTFIYLCGFVNRNQESNFTNSTISLLVNSHPKKFLKEYSSFCQELEPGVWEINTNFFRVHLVEIHKMNLTGLDRLYLGNFSTDEVFYKVLSEEHEIRSMKLFDNIKNIIQDRIIAFEKNPEIRRKYMATVYQADITDLVRPHLEKAEQKGEHKKAIETARKMKEKGETLDKIKMYTGLSAEEIKSL
jgi:hypothetical protein